MSSRLCVKNLPPYLDAKRLKKHFSAQGNVTDARVVKRRDGKSRCFGFVGFETEEGASKAKKFFDKSFIDTARIRVEDAKRVGATDLARPWSKHSKGSSRHKEKHPDQYTKQAKENDEDDSGAAADAESTADGNKEQSAERKLKFQEFMELSKSKSSRQDKPVVDNMDLRDTEGTEGAASQKKKNDRKKAASSNGTDSAFLRGLKVAAFDSDDEDGASAPTGPPKLGETGRLFLRNLPYHCTEDMIRDAFEKQGKVTEVHLPLDNAGRGKGIAFVQFLFPEDAVRALSAYDANFFQGRILHVLPARSRPVEAGDDDEDDNGSEWKKKMRAKKAAAAGNEASWNSLFLRADTVVSRLASHLKIKKSDILDRDGSASMAVQMALAETHVLETTKQQLEEAGVDLSALDEAARGKTAGKGRTRSKTVLLVKNLPVSCSASELTKLFVQFGELGRFVFPEPKVLALVEFLHAADARKAFKGLAFKRFKHAPLYLEWAPRNIFSADGAAAQTSTRSSTSAAAGSAPKATAATLANAATNATAAGGEGVPTIFVKNLNFETTEKRLLAAFKRRCKGVRTARVTTRSVGKGKASSLAPSQRGDAKRVLSMGFGFVEFASHELAMTALKKAQGFSLDGHALELKVARRQAPSTVAPKPKTRKRALAGEEPEESDKLLVRNLAFESTRQEVRELFGSFGQLRSVRIPKKFDGGHRGFGFVEYISKQDAKSAYEQLSSTHFYGRRLVVAWAAARDGIDELRAKSERDMLVLKGNRTDASAGDKSKAFDMEEYSQTANFEMS